MSNKLYFRFSTLPVVLPANPPKISNLSGLCYVIWAGFTLWDVLPDIARVGLTAVPPSDWFLLGVVIVITLGWGGLSVASACGLPRLEIDEGRIIRRDLFGRPTTIELGDYAQVFLDGPNFAYRDLVFLPMQPGQKRRGVNLMSFVTEPGDDEAILGLIRRAAGDRPAPTAEQMKLLAGRRRIEPFVPILSTIFVFGLIAALGWAGLFER
ncbi:hypothetical protein C8J30_101393 [Rhodobacter viridis]|uniref:Uncharacterized protein n=1 Tax=Rhodobacter viridis TaxID=1054202 RepID=A0A318U3D2_9RHOB|nr:hypothetical protein C8J30_101393 [Rhodobacter viridis]